MQESFAFQKCVCVYVNYVLYIIICDQLPQNES